MPNDAATNDAARWGWDADTIRALRLRLEASVGGFAKRLGVSRRTLQRWERGLERPSPLACQRLDAINGGAA